MSVLVVVGAQWGDEGKGGVVDHLATQAQVVARFQGGTNTGHTVVNDLGTFRLHLVPAGIFDPRITCVIGSGVVVDPGELLEEIDQLTSVGVSVDRLTVSDRAHVVMPYHPLLDQLEEAERGSSNLGTTLRGVGPAYEDKVARCGVRMCDLIEETALRGLVDRLVRRKNKLLTVYYGHAPLKVDDVFEQSRAFGERLAPHVTDTSVLLHKAICRRENVLIEGAQATLLDLDYGTYPYVTSSSPTAGGAAAGLGIGPTCIDRVLGVFKAYITRVGLGPFPTEQTNEIGEEIRARGGEYGTTTGRPRRCGWFDAVAARHAVRVNGMNAAAITKLDVLDDFPSIHVCTGYRLDGQVIDYIPASLNAYSRCQPIWETLAGWQAPTSDARTLADLPLNAQRYLACLGELIGCPIELVSVGSHRKQTIVVGSSFT
ncbi:MAG TPA: adenylosuccinate synthase [Chloroflexota bacterium]|nr:adenylosuccinate synthase [Chloroflexota bacterium]